MEDLGKHYGLRTIHKAFSYQVLRTLRRGNPGNRRTFGFPSLLDHASMNRVDSPRGMLGKNMRRGPAMSAGTEEDELPLLSRTPDSWVAAVMREPLLLLNDHAYLEKKAASNALELLNRWPEPAGPAQWPATLAAIASDEAAHLSLVVRLLSRRGGTLERTHRNPYASALRSLVRKGAGNQELLDRLLVSALIEARSCERFDVLARVCDDRELARFYHRLGTSELGHFRVFLHLAEQVVPRRESEPRWEQMLQSEAEILASQPPGPRIHSGA
jgi:tRNA-(ms[2]io[6]A)-hydroxylase